MSFPDLYPVQQWPTSAKEVEGLEFDWFAQDKNGQLAVFTSAGRGGIPQQVFEASVLPYNDFISIIGARCASLAVLEFKGGGRLDDWRLFAEHGLYAYDFQDVHRIRVQKRDGYDLIYSPSCRAMATDLPNHVALSLPVIDTVFGASDLVPVTLIQLSSAGPFM